MSTAEIAALTTRVAGLEGVVGQVSTSTTGDVDAFYLMVVGILVFFMQSGFALLEAGSVRAKNTKNILMKNLLDACLGALIWWGWGYGVAYDGGKDSLGCAKSYFIGTFGDPKGPSFFTGGYNSADHGFAYASWWFQFVFCAACATIVSGSMAERTSLIGYLFYTVVITGFIYPVVVHWSWGYGWTYCWAAKTNSAFIDFAGSGIVHMTGGVAALTGAAIVGPRKGRFDEAKKPITIAAHNSTFQVLGTFILWVGWYGFNPGSTLYLLGSGQTLARCVVTTTLSAAAGGVTVVLTDKLLISHTWDVSMLCNGILAGLVSITAGCGDVYPYAAMIMGFLGGFVYIAASKTVLNVCKIDDPLDAFSVHGACGFWGTISAALFSQGALSGNTARDGLFYGSGQPLAIALGFCFADIAWTSEIGRAHV